MLSEVSRLVPLKALNSNCPDQKPEKVNIDDVMEVPKLLWDFMQHFDVHPGNMKEAKFAQGLFGYTTYDAVQFFDTIQFKIIYRRSATVQFH